MEQRNTKKLIIYSLLFFLVLCSAVIALVAILKAFEVARTKCPGEVEDESEFSYKTSSSKGPRNWGGIHKEWSECNAGLKQSPIDLSDDKATLVTSLGELQQSYKPSKATVVNRGHDIMIKFKDEAGRIQINKTNYFLKQLHWHSPSEHSINGTRLALEMHMVHLSVDKKIAVVGTLYKIGKANPFISKFEKHILAIRKSDHGDMELGKVNPQLLKSNNGSEYYRYIGSLTTPPCTEGVVWTVLRKDSIINARPIQATNQREVRLYRPA